MDRQLCDALGAAAWPHHAIRDFMTAERADWLADVIAVIALYRPGPMGMNAHNDYADRKNGRKEITPIHPELEEPLKEILDETYGLIVYQEQIMRISQKVANYTAGEADGFRKAMGKKKPEVLAQQYDKFWGGMQENGYSKSAMDALWGTIEPFASYAFNKSHAAGYGLVSFWTAYLKAYYAPEYMAALLTSVGDKKDKSAIYLSDCRHLGIKVLPPSVNESEEDFQAVGEDIRFGMGAIRNVGSEVVESIIKSRHDKGAFTSFGDYLDKIELAACNKRITESLIKAGAFDSLGHPRKGLALVHAEAIDAVMTTKRAEADGQFDLFGSFDEPGDDTGGRTDGGRVAVPDPLDDEPAEDRGHGGERQAGEWRQWWR